MRQIKFRGKRVDNGEWVYGHYTEGSVGYHYITKPDGSVNQVDPATIGQFTGLSDDNDKDIYEGDEVVFLSGIKHFVEWNDDTCKFQFSDGSDINDGNRYGTYKVVVSNIHDNPSLLTNK